MLISAREIWPKVWMPSRQRPRVACTTKSLEDQFLERYRRDMRSFWDGQSGSPLPTEGSEAPSEVNHSLARNLRRSTRSRKPPKRYGD